MDDLGTLFPLEGRAMPDQYNAALLRWIQETLYGTKNVDRVKQGMFKTNVKTRKYKMPKTNLTGTSSMIRQRTETLGYTQTN